MKKIITPKLIGKATNTREMLRDKDLSVVRGKFVFVVMFASLSRL